MRGNEKYFSVGLIYVQDIEGQIQCLANRWMEGWMDDL